MVDLCENQYYTGESCKKNRKWKYIFVPPEFFWFPNHGSEEGFWQNCWNNDGQEEHSKNLNNSLDYEYQVELVMFQMIPKSIFPQVSSSFLFELVMKILKPLTLLPSLDEDIDKGSDAGWLRYLFTKAVSLAALNALPAPENPITTPLIEALHFRRGFHYIIVRVNPHTPKKVSIMNHNT